MAMLRSFCWAIRRHAPSTRPRRARAPADLAEPRRFLVRGGLMDLTLLKAVAEQYIPFNRFLGVEATHLERGRARMEIPFREELIGDWMRPALHGGVISMLADTAGGIAVWTALENPISRVSTIDLRVDYLRPGK